MINNNSENGSNRRGVRGGSKKSQYQSGKCEGNSGDGREAWAQTDCDRKVTEDARTWAIRWEAMRWTDENTHGGLYDSHNVAVYGAEYQEVRTELNSVIRARNKSGNPKGKPWELRSQPSCRKLRIPKREIESNVGNSGRNPAVANSGSHAKGALVRISVQRVSSRRLNFPV
ncbi:hypothetical protein FB451DRAFT_1183052 [Mycena latifolia]|nr:hypothetical protein FB451DRAFT_1183052 [Mycena latifolia]